MSSDMEKIHLYNQFSLDPSKITYIDCILKNKDFDFHTIFHSNFHNIDNTVLHEKHDYLLKALNDLKEFVKTQVELDNKSEMSAIQFLFEDEDIDFPDIFKYTFPRIQNTTFHEKHTLLIQSMRIFKSFVDEQSKLEIDNANKK